MRIYYTEVCLSPYEVPNEQGLRDIPTTVLIQLVDLYHTSTDFLLGRTEDPTPPKGIKPQI